MPSAASAPSCEPLPWAGISNRPLPRRRRGPPVRSDDAAERQDGNVVVPVRVGDRLRQLVEDLVEVGVVVGAGEQLLGGSLQALEPDVDAFSAALDEAVGVEQEQVPDGEGHPGRDSGALTEAVDRRAVLADEPGATALDE